LKIEVSDKAYLKDIRFDVKADIKRRLTIGNPAYKDAEKMGRYTGDMDANLKYYDEQGEWLICPRGFMRHLLDISRRYGVEPEISDHRRTLPDVAFQFNGNLRPYQQAAVHAVLLREWAVLEAPTGAGKTVLALAIIAARKQPALIVVHTRELLNQWKEKIHSFLNIPLDEIGQIGGGKFQIGDKITVAIVNSLSKRIDDVYQHIGFIIVDECHRTPGRTFTDCVAGFDCKYMLGLSATPYRRDGLTDVIGFYLGDTVHRIDAKALTQAGHLCRAGVVFRNTEFNTGLDASAEYSRALSELTHDPKRNNQIAVDVAAAASNGSSGVLVLSDRKDHCKALQVAINHQGVDAAVLTGSTPARQRAAIVAGLNDGTVKTVIATGQLIGEGFDCKGLSHLFVATPIKFSGRVLQYAGRVLRPAPGKDQAAIVDYVDERVGVFWAAAESRRRTYQRQGFIIE
jgi:superfamily II DNA or RNA helicase